jgi:peptidoglycan/LPS O-acetylase OafA/YrhL
MTKTKLKHRIEKAVNAFFENDRENYVENSLTLAGDSALLKQETAARFNRKGDVLMKILKRTFLFFPGAFYLFFGTMSVFAFDVIQVRPLAILPIFLIGGFMTIFGIGDIKKPKHLAIPLSISAVGAAAYAIFSMFGGVKAVFDYGIYFFPLALIAAFLAKNLVDKTDEIEN